MKVDAKEIKLFQTKIRKFYRLYGREFPFRMIDDPYAITVSEIMLQQTQVDRVLPKYQAWLTTFPNWQTLADSSNKDILLKWSGLGYNRRALYLKEMAQIVLKNYDGQLPDDITLLKKLPGIGKYTSHAIAIFAFQKRLAAVDTNIRKVLLSNFDFPPETSETETYQLAQLVLPKTKIREWHYALMDFAKTLPTEVHRKYKSKQTQTKFDGSIRQIRGEIIRELTVQKKVTYKTISQKLSRTLKDVKKAAFSLSSDGTIIICNEIIYLKE